jgi:malonyl-CoA O-methyltransferase
VVSAALIQRYRLSVARAGHRLRYWKPVQTGIEQDDDREVVRTLAACRPEEILTDGVRLARPVSPHLAARLAGRPIDMQSLGGVAAAQPPDDRWIVEGAGGLLVPLGEGAFVADLVLRLGLPALVVARSTLGTINHTLLTLEALDARRIGVAGVVIVGPVNRDNREAIEAFGRAQVLGELPPLDPLAPDALARWAAQSLDPEGRLEPWLR